MDSNQFVYHFVNIILTTDEMETQHIQCLCMTDKSQNNFVFCVTCEKKMEWKITKNLPSLIQLVTSMDVSKSETFCLTNKPFRI